MASRTADDRRKIYETFIAAGASTLEATLARDRSNQRNIQDLQRIRERTAEYGPNRPQPERPLSGTPRAIREREQYRKSIAAGASPQDASKYRKYGKKRFKNKLHTLRRAEQRARPSANDVVQARKDKWADWSGRNKFPLYIVRWAQRLNSNSGNTPDAKYGYRIAYRAYVNGQKIDAAVADYQNGVGSP